MHVQKTRSKKRKRQAEADRYTDMHEMGMLARSYDGTIVRVHEWTGLCEIKCQ